MRRKKRDYKIKPMDLSKLKIDLSELDPWQNEVMEYNGNIAIRAGRQVGKSYTMAKKAALFALQNAGVHILVIASSERQASYIYEKIKIELKMLEMDVFAILPTMRRTLLKNGSEIYCLPTGMTGDLIRGLTIDVLIPDEAAYIPERVWISVLPMLWISMKERGFGWIWALSTPCGKEGFFYNCFKNDDYKTWHIKSTDCVRIPKAELERWKEEYTRIQYAQEVLGEFVDDICRFFSESAISKCVARVNRGGGVYYLGVDVARYGADENAFVVVELEGGHLKVIETHTTKREALTQSRENIKKLNARYNFKRIFIDDAGVGGGLTDMLMEIYRHKVVAVNNASRSINKEGKKRAILKEDLYSNAIIMMEDGKVHFENDEDLIRSLRSIMFEYSEIYKRIKIYGRYDHIAEAFVRALWCVKAKGLKLFLSSF